MKNTSKTLTEIRRDYQLKVLDEAHILPDPIMQFETWLNEAINSELHEPTAMVLSTVTLSRKPSSRVVLLKGVSENGLTFFTNYESKKGKEIFANPLVAINFFWPELERQVRIEGRIEKISKEESVNYFHSRPRGSQLGAIASPQSSIIKQRDELEKKITELEKLYQKKLDAIKAYKTQFFNPDSNEPQTYISSKEFLRYIEARALEFGHAIGAMYGEGFTKNKQIGVKSLFDLM